MNLVHLDLEDLDHPGDQRRFDHVGVLGQTLQRPSEKIIVELLGRHPVVVGQPGFVRPLADPIQRLGD